MWNFAFFKWVAQGIAQIRAPKPKPAPVVYMASSFLDIPGLPLGLRNNNPGNLRPLGGGEKWQGELSPADNIHGFSRFSNIAWGIRAMITDIVGDIVQDKKNTIRKLIQSYAPAADSNNTAAYVARVSQLTALSPDQIIPVDQYTIKKLVKAQLRVELGDYYAPMVTDSDIDQAFEILSSEAKGWMKMALANTGAANITALLIGTGALLWALHKRG